MSNIANGSKRVMTCCVSQHHIAPNNLICKILYLGTQPNALKEYLKAKIELAPRINSIFSGHTAVEDYFKDILSN